MSTPTPDSSTHARSRHWDNPTLADAKSRPWFGAALVVVLAGIGVAVDATLMQPAINHVMRGDDPSQTVFLSYAIGATAAAVAWSAGWLWRGSVGNGHTQHSGWVAPAALLAVWAFMGGGIVWLRWQAADIASQSNISFDGQPAATGSAQADHVAAIVFALLFAMTGVLCVVHAYELRNDAFTAKTRAEAQLKDELESLHTLEGLYHHLRENLENHTRHLRNLGIERDITKKMHEQLHGQLLQHSRDQQGILGGDPTWMGITSAAHPTNPASRTTETGDSGRSEQAPS